MARLFLSYARADSGKAEKLAAALQHAGHSVWWDREIHGGSRFAGAIEKALANSDAIVVLWSKASVQSAWVCDEAAEGRDTDRLVPVAIDGSRPPIGFRQFHWVDLSHWKGGIDAAPFVELCKAIEDKAGGSETAIVGRPPRQPPGWVPHVRGVTLIPVLLLVLVIGIAAVFWTRSAKASDNTVAVLPFEDLSPAHDKDYLAAGVAEEILTALGKVPGLRVVGRSTSAALKDRADNPEAIRSKLGIGHLLEGSVRSAGNSLRLSVRLIRTSDGTEEWAQDFNGTGNDIFAFQDKVAGSVAQRLSRGLVNEPTPGSELASADAYDLFLAARQLSRTRDEPHLKRAFDLASKVTAAEPNFAPAHALLGELAWLLSDDSNSYGHIPAARAESFAVAQARQAIALAPKLADGYATLGLVLFSRHGRTGLDPLRRAEKLDPARSEIPQWIALEFDKESRYADAISELRHSVEIDPLFTASVARLALDLSVSGRSADAEQVINRYESQGGSRAEVARMRTTDAYLTGDLPQTIRWGEIARKLDPNIPYVSRYLVAAYRQMGLGQRIGTIPADTAQKVRYAVTTNGPRAAIAAAGPPGRSSWNLPDMDYYAIALGEVGDWPVLIQLYDFNPNAQLDLCQLHPDSAATFVVALRRTGRADEARHLLSCLENRLDRVQLAGPRDPVARIRAEVFALQGRPDQAVAEIDRALTQGWSELTFQPTNFAAFEPLRQRPDFVQAQQRLSAIQARQQAEWRQSLPKGGEPAAG